MEEIRRKFTTEASLETGKDCLVNYVWINKEADRKDREAACSVSLKNVDGAYDNARRYPGARFKVWFDFALLDERSRGCLRDHYERFAPGNVTLCDLNEIPQYRDSEIFTPGTARSLWARVDLARVVVLDFVLQAEPEKYALYSDFDVKDISLRDAKVKMDEYGLALATIAIQDNAVCKYTVTTSCGPLENSYFGFSRDERGQAYLKNLLSATLTDAQSNQNGFCALVNSFSKWSAKRHPGKLAVEFIVPRILNSQNYKIPDKDIYREWGWNIGAEPLCHRAGL